MKTTFRTLFIALGLVVWSAFLARAATVTATLDPAEISMGDSAQLTVTVSGAQGQPTMPNVDGLDITPVGQSTQIEIVNGSITANASYTYNITPQREGTFTIPALRLSNAASQPLTLRVSHGAGINSAPSTAQQPMQQPGGNGPVVNPPQQQANDNASLSGGRFGSIQITVPKKEFYEGETAPIDIKVAIPERLQAQPNMPEFTSDGFGLGNLSTKPEQNVEMVGNRPCVVLTWHTTLTAVKTGDFPVGVDMDETVVVPVQRQMPTDADDMFQNLFRNMFQQGEKKNVTLKSDPITVKVLPLPMANRPADFAGAVGQFDVEASAAPTKVNAGDPITLKLKITGTGDFDRVSSDMMASGGPWKTYSAKNHFDANDSVGYSGTKTFEQPIVPSDSGVTSIPPISFSYFDPEKRDYVTRTTPPIPVSVSGAAVASTVTPAPAAGVPSPTPPPPAPTEPQAASPLTSADGLRAIKIDAGTFASTLRPVYLSPAFIVGQALPLVALLCGLLFIRQREILANPSRVRSAAVQQAIRQQVSAMDVAMNNHQIDAFFIHARAALQQRLGQQWNMKPETITLAEIDRHLGEGNETIRPIFAMADQASYSDLHFEDADLRQWREVVLNELAEKNS